MFTVPANFFVYYEIDEDESKRTRSPSRNLATRRWSMRGYSLRMCEYSMYVVHMCTVEGLCARLYVVRYLQVCVCLGERPMLNAVAHGAVCRTPCEVRSVASTWPGSGS